MHMGFFVSTESTIGRNVTANGDGGQNHNRKILSQGSSPAERPRMVVPTGTLDAKGKVGATIGGYPNRVNVKIDRQNRLGGPIGSLILLSSGCCPSFRLYVSHQKLACSIVRHVTWQTLEQAGDQVLHEPIAN